MSDTQDNQLQSCGHPLSAIVSSGDGTMYCGDCVEGAQADAFKVPHFPDCSCEVRMPTSITILPTGKIDRLTFERDAALEKLRQSEAAAAEMREKMRKHDEHFEEFPEGACMWDFSEALSSSSAGKSILAELERAKATIATARQNLAAYLNGEHADGDSALRAVLGVLEGAAANNPA